MQIDTSCFFGHDQIVTYFNRLLENGNFAHAYCFTGPKHVGKATLARIIAAQLAGVDVHALATCSDVICMDQSDGSLGIEEVRSFVNMLSLSRLGKGYKLAIIDGADAMTIPAQNALLKTLEEPSEKTVIFLITHTSTGLLQTIRSRCVDISFQQQNENVLQAFAQKHQLFDKEIIQKMLFFARGRPGVLLQLANEEYQKQVEGDAQQAYTFFKEPLYKRMKRIEALTKDRQARKQNAQNMIELWRMWLYEALRSVHKDTVKEVASLSMQFTQQELVRALEALCTCEQAFERNVSPALSLQVFASSFNE